MKKLICPECGGELTVDSLTEFYGYCCLNVYCGTGLTKPAYHWDLTLSDVSALMIKVEFIPFSWSEALGDTIKEKLESLYSKMLDVVNILNDKKIDHNIIVASPKILEMLECYFGFSDHSTTNVWRFKEDAVPYKGVINKRWCLYQDNFSFRDVLVITGPDLLDGLGIEIPDLDVGPI